MTKHNDGTDLFEAIERQIESRVAARVGEMTKDLLVIRDELGTAGAAFARVLAKLGPLLDGAGGKKRSKVIAPPGGAPASVGRPPRNCTACGGPGHRSDSQRCPRRAGESKPAAKAKPADPEDGPPVRPDDHHRFREWDETDQALAEQLTPVVVPERVFVVDLAGVATKQDDLGRAPLEHVSREELLERYPSPDDDIAVPALELARARGGVTAAGRVRSKTIAPGRVVGIIRTERRAAELIVYPDDVDRPRVRADCISMSRPCPFVSCTHHLYLDVNPDTGAIKLNFPHLEVWEMAETCSLDVADRGGVTLEEVAAHVNLTRERIWQVETRGLAKMRAATPAVDVPDHPAGNWEHVA